MLEELNQRIVNDKYRDFNPQIIAIRYDALVSNYVDFLKGKNRGFDPRYLLGLNLVQQELVESGAKVLPDISRLEERLNLGSINDDEKEELSRKKIFLGTLRNVFVNLEREKYGGLPTVS